MLEEGSLSQKYQAEETLAQNFREKERTTIEAVSRLFIITVTHKMEISRIFFFLKPSKYNHSLLLLILARKTTIFPVKLALRKHH